MGVFYFPMMFFLPSFLSLFYPLYLLFTFFTFIFYLHPFPQRKSHVTDDPLPPPFIHFFSFPPPAFAPGHYPQKSKPLGTLYPSISLLKRKEDMMCKAITSKGFRLSPHPTYRPLRPQMPPRHKPLRHRPAPLRAGKDRPGPPKDRFGPPPVLQSPISWPPETGRGEDGGVTPEKWGGWAPEKEGRISHYGHKLYYAK
jgi:hypothetical protein